MSLNEVAPPGFGHTKGDEKKGVKKGGPAAAFDRARKRGDFKGSKSDMFAIMWSQKNKGDKPHYKPGTDKKYKKYQDEGVDITKYEKLKKKIGSKEKHDKAVMVESMIDLVRKYSKKKKDKKPQKAMDAGARATRLLQRKEYASKVSGSTSNVPDDIRDHLQIARKLIESKKRTMS